ncbi:hypothetical protein [Mycobacterium aquaticum]|uniref:DUF4242 domain-containing protein n=1 Tax=Mycobacterium aquaticum TaxID=1927124 RepID=A0A1X0B5S6_9MYCO|nr:hypothetical protein [Mycobacterium aquaticum]ORA37633.1 hypothetical protein BST13_07250 [Mycobacterium aquaticum]
MRPAEPCYLVEWYSPKFLGATLALAAETLDATATSLSTDKSPIRVSAVIAVPDDEVAFGIFVAGSADIVTRTCEQAGIPAQRVSAAADVEFLSPA